MLPATPSPRLRGAIIVTAGVVLVSFDALLVRLAAVDGWNVACWRGLFIALVMGGVQLWRRDSGRESRAGLGLAALLMGVSSLSLVQAFTLTRAANAVVILSAAPLFAALFSRIFLGERCPPRTWLAILACMAGVLWVVSGSIGGGSILGDSLALLSTFCIGAYFTVFRRHPNLSRTLTIACSGALTMLFALPFATPLSLPVESYGWLAVSGLVQMPLAMLLMTLGTRLLPAAEVALFLMIETLLAPIWVWLVLAEVPPRATWAGGLLILATLTLHTLWGLRRPQD